MRIVSRQSDCYDFVTIDLQVFFPSYISLRMQPSSRIVMAGNRALCALLSGNGVGQKKLLLLLGNRHLVTGLRHFCCYLVTVWQWFSQPLGYLETVLLPQSSTDRVSLLKDWLSAPSWEVVEEKLGAAT